MNALLSFSPEPFADLDKELNEFESTVSELENDEADEEVRRRSRTRPSRGTRSGIGRSASVIRNPKVRILPPPTTPSHTLPRLSRGLRTIPVRRLIPAIPFIPPLIGLPSYPLPPPLRDVPPTDASRHTEQATKSEGSGNPPTTQSSEEPGSEYIRWVQDCLNKALGLQLPVDGIMTRETRSAVRNFQERQGLSITGLVGPETQESLKSFCTGVLTTTNNIESTPKAEGETQYATSPSRPLCNRRATMNYQLSFEPELFKGNSDLEEFKAPDTKIFTQWQGETNTKQVSVSLSPTRLRFEDAVTRGDWREAFLNLNGLNMYEMLRALNSLPPDSRKNLKTKRQIYRALVNMPRIDFALHVVENRALPIFVPWGLPADQIRTAEEFIGQGPAIPPSNLSPKDLAIGDKPLAHCWLKQGHLAAKHLYDLIRGTSGVSTTERSRLFENALGAHFKMPRVIAKTGQPPSTEKSNILQRLKIIIDTYQLILTLFPNDSRLRNSQSGTAPAFTYYNGSIFFTKHFKPFDPITRQGFARTARAAMIAHEYVHVVDPQSGQPQNHISEWDERYDHMTPLQSIHNPSSYSAFGQHVCYGFDTRFGAGEPEVELPPEPSCCSL